jgi:transposase
MRPVQYAWHRHDRLSVIGSLSISPNSRHLGVAFLVQDTNVRTPDVIAYLRALHRQLRRPLIVVLDRLSAHRSAVRKLHQAGASWLTAEWLPPYAPDLNPVEAMWSYAKYCDLANFVPDDVDHLCDAVINSLGDTYFNQQLQRSFFHSAQLNL